MSWKRYKGIEYAAVSSQAIKWTSAWQQVLILIPGSLPHRLPHCARLHMLPFRVFYDFACLMSQSSVTSMFFCRLHEIL